uniref:Reverse transcriptase domain-containing protein n=1 Tax=Amphimedon queenslandica TaxID=400682 RepID=A0A1X7TT34_AMPQE
MLDKNIISRSHSPWSTPIILVQIKDGSLQFCVDYCRINEVTREDAYHLPRIDETLDTLSGSSWFTTLDLLSGYWQVEVAEQDRDKTAFCTCEALFHFNVMPFGLCNAPATFE